MRVLFTTDLHGQLWKYDRLLTAAICHHVDLVINGGDLLPAQEPLVDKQRLFLQTTLDEHLAGFQKAGIAYFACPGNDDVQTLDGLFGQIMAKYSVAGNLAQQRICCQGFEFIGMNLVEDYPFALKDRCRLDQAGQTAAPMDDQAMISADNQLQPVADWPGYVAGLPSLQEELARLPKPENPAKTIYVIHMPPTGLGLDECESGEQVGSVAVYRFLSQNQPLAALHGHVHESPEMGGRWQNQIGRTRCFQPGQLQPFTYLLLDLTSGLAERILIQRDQTSAD